MIINPTATCRSRSNFWIKAVGMVISCCLLNQALQAQQRNQSTFGFLVVPSHARLAGLGGVNVSLHDADVNMLQSNPALVGDSLAGWTSVSYQFYLAKVSQTMLSYADQFHRIGEVHMALQHLDYGIMEGFDASGANIGEFQSGETALIIGKSHQVGHYRLGANIKGIFSNIAGWRSSAIGFDLGGIFIHPRNQLTIGLVIKNMGFVLSHYAADKKSVLPFDLQFGTTFKPEHMPIRFSFTAYRLVDGNMTYFNPADGEEEPTIFDKIFRHFNFGADILLHKNIHISLGYNYLIRRELQLEEVSGGAGISFGFSLHVKSFDIAYSRSGYVIGTAANTFSVSTNLKNRFKRKK